MLAYSSSLQVTGDTLILTWVNATILLLFCFTDQSFSSVSTRFFNDFSLPCYVHINYIQSHRCLFTMLTLRTAAFLQETFPFFFFFLLSALARILTNIRIKNQHSGNTTCSLNPKESKYGHLNGLNNDGRLNRAFRLSPEYTGVSGCHIRAALGRNFDSESSNSFLAQLCLWSREASYCSPWLAITSCQ